MLNFMFTFIADHPFTVLFSCLVTTIIAAIIGGRIRIYENAYDIPHVLSNSILLVIIAYGGLLIYGVNQTQFEAVDRPAYKNLDMTQTFVFKTKQEKTDDADDGLLTKGYQALLGKPKKKNDPTVDTSKTITADMIDYLKSREGLTTTMVVSKDGQKTEQDVMIDKVTVKGNLQKGNTAKITKVAFKKPNTYRVVVFGHKATHTTEFSDDNSVAITVEAIDNPVNKQFD